MPHRGPCQCGQRDDWTGRFQIANRVTFSMLGKRCGSAEIQRMSSVSNQQRRWPSLVRPTILRPAGAVAEYGVGGAPISDGTSTRGLTLSTSIERLCPVDRQADVGRHQSGLPLRRARSTMQAVQHGRRTGSVLRQGPDPVPTLGPRVAMGIDIRPSPDTDRGAPADRPMEVRDISGLDIPSSLSQGSDIRSWTTSR
jgi:hypothetical protein